MIYQLQLLSGALCWAFCGEKSDSWELHFVAHIMRSCQFCSKQFRRFGPIGSADSPSQSRWPEAIHRYVKTATKSALISISKPSHVDDVGSMSSSCVYIIKPVKSCMKRLNMEAMNMHMLCTSKQMQASQTILKRSTKMKTPNFPQQLYLSCKVI